ncbi:MAG: FISUMP domain-containing protein [Fibrobacterota bacterium]
MIRPAIRFATMTMIPFVAMLWSCDLIDGKASTSPPSLIDTAAVPVLVPSGGIHYSSQSVAIGCITSGTTIYYTTNGDDPTTSSLQYENPIVVNSSQTLKAIAVRNGMATSPIGTGAFTIELGGSTTKSVVEWGGKTYKTVTIGSQTWMAENLNVKVDSSWWYDNDPDTGRKYGRLYKWSAMLGIPDSCTGTISCASMIRPKHQGICPTGWHLPADSDWSVLLTNIGGKSTAGKLLKSTSGWDGSDNGVDEYGFTALPAGYLVYDRTFHSLHTGTIFWSTSQTDHGAFRRTFNLMGGPTGTFEGQYMASSGYSVRCLKD